MNASPATRLYDDFLKKISYLPAVQQAVKEESQRQLSDSAAARRDCLASLQGLRAAETAAREALASAVQALDKARTGIEAQVNKAGMAQQALDRAARDRQAAECALSRVHGESHVQRALYMLNLLRDNEQRKIGNTASLLKNTVREDGSIAIRYIKPEDRARLATEKQKLEHLEKAYAIAEGLIESDLSPADIETRCAALLREAGYVPNSTRIEGQGF